VLLNALIAEEKTKEEIKTASENKQKAILEQSKYIQEAMETKIINDTSLTSE